MRSAKTRTEAIRTLEKAQAELQVCARAAESGMGALARGFEGLAAQTDALLNLAATIVGGVDNEKVSSVLPNVQTLGAVAKRFIGERLADDFRRVGDGVQGSGVVDPTLVRNAGPGGDCVWKPRR